MGASLAVSFRCTNLADFSGNDSAVTQIKFYRLIIYKPLLLQDAVSVLLGHGDSKDIFHDF